MRKNSHKTSAVKLIASIVFSFVVLTFTTQLHAQLPAGFTRSTVQVGYAEPMGVVFSSTGQFMFVWDRSGRVFISNFLDTGYIKQSQPIIDITDEVGYWGDHGLMSFCLSPTFEQDTLVYLYYIVDRHHLLHAGTPQYNPLANDYFNATIARVTRYKLTRTPTRIYADSASRKVLIGESSSTGIPVLYFSHAGRSLVFGSDKTLLLSTGEGSSFAGTDSGNFVGSYYGQALADGIIRPGENVGAFRAQMINSHSGKILRFDPNTGNGIPSNPFYDPAHPRSPQSRVWAMGCRNPYQMTIEPNTGSTNPANGNPGTIYIGDVGYNTWEEINIVKAAGLNMGWPLYEGQTTNPPYFALNKINPDDGFVFKNRCLQPTSFAIDPVVANRRLTHYRPAIAWKHGINDTRVPWFNGTVATDPQVGAAGSPVTGDMFNGNCVIGGVFYTGTAFGAAYQNTYMFADFTGNWINVAHPVAQQPFLNSITKLAPAGYTNSIVDMEQNPLDNSLVYVDIFSGGIMKIHHTNSVAPVVSITSPVAPATFPAGSTIQITAAANDPDGTIAKVELFYGALKIGEDATSPYNFSGSNVEPGVYKLVAKATDNQNNVGVSDTLTVTITACSGTGAISGEGYTNIPGTQVANLMAHPSYPNNPAIIAALPSFEYSSVGDNYGGRLSGYICAPVTGNYTFYIAGDDQAGLFLSTNDNPANKTLIAYTLNPVPFRAWTANATQKSAPVYLVKGARYYIETLHKQSTGTNHLSVGWVLPNGIAEGPIPGNRLSPFITATAAVNGSATTDFAAELRKVIQPGEKTGGLIITVQPNPSFSDFTLVTKSNSEEKLDIKLTDMQGRIVERLPGIAANKSIKLGEKLLPGVYFIEVSQGTQRKILKLIKQ